jgi:flagellar motor protein MotB
MINQPETITRDTRSYRQGMVLGLTMAEVFLLLVFALLIALAVLWNSEKQKRRTLEGEPRPPSVESAADRRLLEDVRAAMKATSPDRVTKAIDHLRNGRDLEPLTNAEKEFVTEVRAQQSRAVPEAISDQWRTLTRAARNLDGLAGTVSISEAIKRVLPEEKDWRRLVPLIEKGLAAERKGEHDWPPIINLSEAKEHFFEKGKAELKPDFEAHLRTTVVPLLVERAQRFGVTTIEVIGHTDEQKIAPRNSNLDSFLLDTVQTTGNVSNLVPADNAGLGLARATAVVRVLGSDERLKGYTLLPLSGGQLIGVDDRLASGGGGDDPERRRIEIRLRRANIFQATTGALGPHVTTPAARPQSASPQSPPGASPQSPRVRPRDRAVAPQWFLFGTAPIPPTAAR